MTMAAINSNSTQPLLILILPKVVIIVVLVIVVLCSHANGYGFGYNYGYYSNNYCHGHRNLHLMVPAHHGHGHGHGSSSSYMYGGTGTSTSTRLWGGGTLRGALLPALLDAIQAQQEQEQKQDSSTNAESSSNTYIKSLIDEIGRQNEPFMRNDPTLPNRLSANWRLLWTTEKETLFFKQRGLFGAKVTDISQSIDVKRNTIQNVIAFEGNKRFVVDGVLSQAAELEPALRRTRLNFKFSRVTLEVPPFNVPLPPVGSGWFDNVFVNDRYRLSRDIRGDYLVTQRIA